MPPSALAGPVVQASASLTPAVVVSICAVSLSVLALAFTISSFWWLNARRGTLRAFQPHSFAASLNATDLLINLPLVFHNPGAAPIVVQNLRLRLTKAGKEADPLVMWWRSTRPAVQPEAGARPLPAAFPIAGRKAEQMFIEFGLRQPSYVPLDGPYRADVECKFGHADHWQSVASFELNTEVVQKDAGYIAYSNEPTWQA